MTCRLRSAWQIICRLLSWETVIGRGWPICFSLYGFGKLGMEKPRRWPCREAYISRTSPERVKKKAYDPAALIAIETTPTAGKIAFPFPNALWDDGNINVEFIENRTLRTRSGSQAMS